jgi:hypothetical protein
MEHRFEDFSDDFQTWVIFVGRSGSGADGLGLRMKQVPKVIPPRTRVRLVRADRKTPAWKKEIGREFRVGYYSRQDGLDCIWLVNERGEYEETTDREFLLKYFDILRLSDERDYYGVNKRRLGPLKSGKKISERRKPN